MRGRRLRKIRRIGPSSDGEEQFQMAVLLLEEEKLFNTAIYVGSYQFNALAPFKSNHLPGVLNNAFIKKYLNHSMNRWDNAYPGSFFHQSDHVQQ